MDQAFSTFANRPSVATVWARDLHRSNVGATSLLFTLAEKNTTGRGPGAQEYHETAEFGQAGLQARMTKGPLN